MQKSIIVIDDDVVLVAELLTYLQKFSPRTLATGPPDLLLDLPDIREKSANAAAIVLDLKIGGSGTYGVSILKKMRKLWERLDTPVIVWSKYLSNSILFEPGRIVLTNDDGSVWREIDNTAYSALLDSARIDDLRSVSHSARAFVTKAAPEPVVLLARVLERLKLIEVENTA